jgi:hypothetical protein
MRKFIVAVLIVAAIIALATDAGAKGHYRRVGTTAEFTYPASYWTYQKWVPWGAYQTTVTYGPGNRRCVSQLVHLPNDWWRPTRRCEIVMPG